MCFHRGEKRSIKHQIRSIGTTEYTRAHLEAGLGSWCERNTSFCAINNTRFLFHDEHRTRGGRLPPPPRPKQKPKSARARDTRTRATRGKRRLSRRELGGRYPPTPRPRPRHHYRALPAKSPETPKSRPCVLEVRVDDLGGPRGPGGFGPPRRSRSQQPRGATPHRRADRDA